MLDMIEFRESNILLEDKDSLGFSREEHAKTLDYEKERIRTASDPANLSTFPEHRTSSVSSEAEIQARWYDRMREKGFNPDNSYPLF